MRSDRALGVVAMLAVICPSAAAAQTEIPESFEVNVPYAHYYGTGAYGIGGERVAVVSLKGTFPFGTYDPERVRFNARAAVTFAWQRVDVTDSAGLTLPFFTIVPGIGLDIPLSDRVVLQPFVDAGVVRDVEGDAWMGLGTIGSELEWVLPWKRFEIGIEPIVGYSRTFSSDEFADDDLFAAFLMLDVRRALGFRLAGEPADLGVYALYSNLWGDTDLSATVSNTVEIERQLEFGASFGMNPRPKVWLVRLPRLSIGYRFGKGFRGLRISLSDRRLRLPPR